jgi:predicted nucleic acid-binding protein
VVKWLAEKPRALVVISLLTFAELQYGASVASDATQRRRLTLWLESSVVPSFGNRILPLTTEILVDWLGLARALNRRRTGQAASDLLLASTARVHNLIVVTRNVRDFAGTGIVVYDPWHDRTHRMDTP